MGIIITIAMLMVPAMLGDPFEQGAFDGHCAEDRPLAQEMRLLAGLAR